MRLKGVEPPRSFLHTDLNRGSVFVLVCFSLLEPIQFLMLSALSFSFGPRMGPRDSPMSLLPHAATSLGAPQVPRSRILGA